MKDSEIESLKKKSLTHLELSKDTKVNVTNAEMDKMARELKQLASRKNIIVMVFER